jgi:hypothetical protein
VSRNDSGVIYRQYVPLVRRGNAKPIGALRCIDRIIGFEIQIRD